MKSSFKITIAAATAVLLASVAAMVVVITPLTANANQHEILGELCAPEGQANFDVNCNKNSAEAEVNNVVVRIVRTAAWVAGIVSMIVLIVGAIKYTVSGGDPQQTASARSTIIYAIVGIIVSLSAAAVMTFLLREADTTNPTIDNAVTLSTNIKIY